MRPIAVLERGRRTRSVDVKGVDFALSYRLPEFSFGRFNVSLDATYLEKYDVSTAPGTPANTVYNYPGHFMAFGSGACPGAGGGVCLFPRWRAQSSVNWQLGAFDASWRMRYIGRFQMGSAAPSRRMPLRPYD
jgi:outer membrane receptor protein involved in Fe transport